MADQTDGAAQEGARLSTALLTLGISKSEAARRVGISVSYMTNLANGNRSATDRVLADIERALGVSARWIRTGVGSADVASASTDSSPPAAPQTLVVSEPQSIDYNGVAEMSTAQLVSQMTAIARELERRLGVAHPPAEMHELVDQAYAQARGRRRA